MNAAARQTWTEPTALARASILLLEDNPFQRAALAQVITGLGVGQLVEAATVAEALAHVDQAPDGFDIALCDLQLGEDEGVTFLQQAAPGKVRSFVLVSALDMTDLLVARRRALESGSRVTGVLAKPVRRQDLVAILNRAMDEAERTR